MEAQASIKSGESYHISGSATRGESYRISGSFNHKRGLFAVLFYTLVHFYTKLQKNFYYA